MRDRLGRFLPLRTYRLHYDDGQMESVKADTPSEAVRNRARVMLPHTVIDLDILIGRDGEHKTPLLNRIYGPEWGERGV